MEISYEIYWCMIFAKSYQSNFDFNTLQKYLIKFSLASAAQAVAVSESYY